jgi:Lon protease-like protein
MQHFIIFALLSTFLVGQCPAFSPPRVSLNLQRTQQRLSSAADDVDFMASLRSRMDQVSDRATKLPLVVLDSMLPRQVLRINVNNPVFMDLVRSRLQDENPCFGMLGMARLQSGERVHLRSGVEVQIVGKPSVSDEGMQLELQGGRRFRIEGDVENAPRGWTEGRVKFLSSEHEESDEGRCGGMTLARAMFKARNISVLVNEWIVLARRNERLLGQIDQLLLDLGTLPPPEAPSECAYWVGALINPIPAMGVALEIRPSLLTAKTSEQRIDIALDGIEKSIKHMDGSKLLF